MAFISLHCVCYKPLYGETTNSTCSVRSVMRTFQAQQHANVKFVSRGCFMFDIFYYSSANTERDCYLAPLCGPDLTLITLSALLCLVLFFILGCSECFVSAWQRVQTPSDEAFICIFNKLSFYNLRVNIRLNTWVIRT